MIKLPAFISADFAKVSGVLLAVFGFVVTNQPALLSLVPTADQAAVAQGIAVFGAVLAALGFHKADAK